MLQGTVNVNVRNDFTFFLQQIHYFIWEIKNLIYVT